MLELITATCRALACDAKLAVLYQLRTGEELAATEIAVRVGVPLDHLGHHLARLAMVGLVSRRRSGRKVLYGLADGASARFNAVSPLRHALAEPQWATKRWREKSILHLSSPLVTRLSRVTQRAMDVVFDAATAFGNVRRLQLLRVLFEGGQCDPAAAVSELRMSPLAFARHIEKLESRGYVRDQRAAGWSLAARPRTAFHGALLSEVGAALALP